eukprot:2984471-Pleurochrysis_carterae.AAC.1
MGNVSLLRRGRCFLAARESDDACFFCKAMPAPSACMSSLFWLRAGAVRQALRHDARVAAAARGVHCAFGGHSHTRVRVHL